MSGADKVVTEEMVRAARPILDNALPMEVFAQYSESTLNHIVAQIYKKMREAANGQS